MGRLVLKGSNMSDELSKIVSSINELSERVALLEIDRDFANIIDTDIGLPDRPAADALDFDWADVSNEKINNLLADIFANDPVAERPLEYNKIQDNVIEFPVKFSRR